MDKKERFAVKNSWQLLRSSWHFICRNKDLLVFPLISLTASASVALLMLFSCFFGPSAVEILHACNPEAIAKSAQVLMLLRLIVFYLIASMITIFCNGALMVVATRRLQGKSCHIYQGLQGVSRRWRSLVSANAVFGGIFLAVLSVFYGLMKLLPVTVGERLHSVYALGTVGILLMITLGNVFHSMMKSRLYVNEKKIAHKILVSKLD